MASPKAVEFYIIASTPCNDCCDPIFLRKRLLARCSQVPLRRKFYGGVKNLLNFTPAKNSIARAFDPFDREVQFDALGNLQPSAGNPYALTFDPTYVYASNQGIRFFMGFRWSLN